MRTPKTTRPKRTFGQWDWNWFLEVFTYIVGGAGIFMVLIGLAGPDSTWVLFGMVPIGLCFLMAFVPRLFGRKKTEDNP